MSAGTLANVRGYAEANARAAETRLRDALDTLADDCKRALAEIDSKGYIEPRHVQNLADYASRAHAQSEALLHCKAILSAIPDAPETAR